jgi:hypothetical protein
MADDIVVKIALVILGAMLSMLGAFFVWGFQRLVTTLLDNGKELIKIEHRLGDIEKSIEPLAKMEKDLNNYYQRLKIVELKQGEKSL